jgi:hypothetical protein
MAIRIPVTVVIELDDEQQAEFAEYRGLGKNPRAKDVVASVHAYVLTHIRGAPAFGLTGDGTGGRGAHVSIKER